MIRRIVVIVFVAALTGGHILPVAAHGPEKNIPARDLVRQAIAILRSQPERDDEIADKIADVLDAKDSSSVDFELIRQAARAPDPHTKEDLLERAIGLSPHTLFTSPNDAPGQAALPGPAAPAYAVHVTAYKGGPRLPRSPQDWALLAASALTAAIGFLVARKVR